MYTTAEGIFTIRVRSYETGEKITEVTIHNYYSIKHSFYYCYNYGIRNYYGRGQQL